VNWLLRNSWLKISAFGLALLVWIHVATEKEYNYQLYLPVTEIILDEELTLTTMPPDSIFVSVSATGKQLLRQKWQKRGLLLNINQYPAGKHIVALNTSNISLLQQTTNVTLSDITAPTQVQLFIDQVDSQLVPVVANLDVVADDGFIVGQAIIIKPESVLLKGPRSSLSTVQTISTEFRKMRDLKNNVTINLSLIDPPGYGFSMNPDTVEVTIPIFTIKTRVFKNLRVVILNAPPERNLTTNPPVLIAEVTGIPEAIEKLLPNSLSVTVDYHQKNSSSVAEVRFDSPPGFHLRRLSSDSVKIVDK